VSTAGRRPKRVYVCVHIHMCCSMLQCVAVCQDAAARPINMSELSSKLSISEFSNISEVK